MEDLALELEVFGVNNLLKIIRPTPFNNRKQGGTPIATEFPVTTELAPFLVTTTGSLTWVLAPVQGTSMVRAAARTVKTSQLYREIVESVIIMGQHAEWGNRFALTLDGVEGAVMYLKSFGLEDIELLCPHLIQSVETTNQRGERVMSEVVTDTDLKALLDEVEYPVRPCSWLPYRTVVVVPKIREYVGVVSMVSQKSLMACVHNAARGMAFVCER